jgi:hypothetical protein
MRNVRNVPYGGRRIFDEEVSVSLARGGPLPASSPTSAVFFSPQKCQKISGTTQRVSCLGLPHPSLTRPPAPPLLHAQRIPLVADFEHAGLGAASSTKHVTTTRAGRCVNRVVCTIVAVGTLCALGVAAWFHLDKGLFSHSDAREARSPFPLIAHEIWLGDQMPVVKRMLYERNEEVLEPWGWSLRLWGLGDVTPDNFPHTYRTIKRGLDHHAATGQNVFSMVGDLMKFEILYRHGGLYLDTNVEMMRWGCTSYELS